MIKFVSPGEPAEITAVDIGVLELKLGVSSLEASSERIQEQIDEYVLRDLHVAQQAYLLSAAQ